MSSKSCSSQLAQHINSSGDSSGNGSCLVSGDHDSESISISSGQVWQDLQNLYPNQQEIREQFSILQ